MCVRLCIFPNSLFGTHSSEKIERLYREYILQIILLHFIITYRKQLKNIIHYIIPSIRNTKCQK